jgi:hypothetical protein
MKTTVKKETEKTVSVVICNLDMTGNNKKDTRTKIKRKCYEP